MVNKTSFYKALSAIKFNIIALLVIFIITYFSTIDYIKVIDAIIFVALFIWTIIYFRRVYFKTKEDSIVEDMWKDQLKSYKSIREKF